MTKKIKVLHTFLNKKGVFKSVEFYMDSKLYNDILTLPENEKNYWLEFYYHEFCNEQYSERKAFKNREQFINADQEEQEDEEVRIVASKNKLKQITDNTNDEQAMFNKLIVDEILDLLNEDERFCIEQVFKFGRTIISVANEMKIDESTVRKKIKIAKEKIKNNYNL